MKEFHMKEYVTNRLCILQSEKLCLELIEEKIIT